MRPIMKALAVSTGLATLAVLVSWIAVTLIRTYGQLGVIMFGLVAVLIMTGIFYRMFQE